MPVAFGRFNLAAAAFCRLAVSLRCEAVARPASALVLAFTATISTVSLASSEVPPARFDDAQRKQRLIEALPRVESAISDGMLAAKLPGVVYGVVIDNETVLVKGLGVRDVETGSLVDSDTVFRIASMTKSFTALAILKLRDDGKLRLDDAADLYVPELRGWAAPTKDSGPITIRQLLSHTAGFPEDNPQGDRVLDIKPEALSAWLAGGIPFSTAPGSQFEYSNLGFMLLGSVVAKASGRPFQQFITSEILLPLRMTSTYWSVSQVPKDRLAKGYRRDKEAWVEEPILEDGAGAAMGGLMTSANDLARYIAMMLSANPPRDDSERPPAARRTLREMQVGLGYPEILAARSTPGARLIARSYSYGYGLFAIKDCTWGREIQHGGGLPGYGSHMRWLPDHGVGVFVLANQTYADASALTRAAITVLYDTGALKARKPSPSPALLRASDTVAQLLTDWQDERARAIAADNLFLDESLDERKRAINELRAGLGSCKPSQVEAENALRGKFRLDCEKGWLNVQLTLAPVNPAKVQFLEVSGGKPASAAMRQAAEAVVAAIGSGGAQQPRLGSDVNRRDLAARLEASRIEYGACRLGDVTEGDGTTTAKFNLACDRGSLELSISMKDDRTTNVALSPSPTATCVP